MKKVLHYLILALILIGIPVLTAGMFGSDEIWNGLLNFPPRTEDWGLDPSKSWNVRYPFSWWVFIPLAILVICVCLPLDRQEVGSCLKAEGQKWYNSRCEVSDETT